MASLFQTAANLTQKRLREVISYDGNSGDFTWSFDGAYRRMAGKLAGHVCHRGYRRIKVDGVLYLAHRLAWLYVTGDWPKHEVDHINGMRSDNRLDNLRDVSTSMNHQNLHLAHADSYSGLLGVSFDKRRGNWAATIWHEKSNMYLGRFGSSEAAHEAYIEAKRRLHPGCTI